MLDRTWAREIVIKLLIEIIPRLKGSDLIILISLILRADENGEAELSMNQLKAACGLNETTIRRSLRRLYNLQLQGRRVLYSYQTYLPGQFGYKVFVIFNPIV